MSHCFSLCGFRTGIVSRPSHFLIILHCVFLCYKIKHAHTLLRRPLPWVPAVKLAARGPLAQPPLPLRPPLCWTPWNGAVPLLPLLLPHCAGGSWPESHSSVFAGLGWNSGATLCTVGWAVGTSAWTVGITDSNCAPLFDGSSAPSPFSTSAMNLLAATRVSFDVRWTRSRPRCWHHPPLTYCIMEGGLSRTKEAKNVNDSCFVSPVACCCHLSKAFSAQNSSTVKSRSSRFATWWLSPQQADST